MARLVIRKDAVLKSTSTGAIAAIGVLGVSYLAHFIAAPDLFLHLGPFREFRFDLTGNYFVVAHISIAGVALLALAFAAGFWWKFRKASR